MASPASSSPVRDLGLLVGRIVLGVVFAAHGYQKISDWGLEAVTSNFAGMGVPLPEIIAPVVAFLELIGGIMLIVGVLTRPVGVLLAVNMLAAALIVHIPQGLFVDQGGWELVGALGAGSLILAATGPGGLAVDRFLTPRGRGSRSRAASVGAED